MRISFFFFFRSLTPALRKTPPCLMHQTIFFFYSVAQLYLDATVVRRKPVVPHWDRSGIHLLSTLLFTRIHESSIRIKRIKPGTHTATRSQLQLKRPSSLPHTTLKSLWIVNSEIRKSLSQQLTIIRYSCMNANRSANMTSRGVQFEWGAQLYLVGGAACFCC